MESLTTAKALDRALRQAESDVTAADSAPLSSHVLLILTPNLAHVPKSASQAQFAWWGYVPWAWGDDVLDRFSLWELE